MPWQPSGNGRSGWSTKLIRGLKAEAAAGFQSRRERCCEPTPVTPQYAAFTTYKGAWGAPPVLTASGGFAWGTQGPTMRLEMPESARLHPKNEDYGCGLG